MKNKEIVSIDEVRRGYIPFDDGFCYKVLGETYAVERHTDKVYKKLPKFQREYIGNGKDVALIIYKYINKDFVNAVEETRNKAITTLKLISDIEILIETEKDCKKALELIKTHKATFTKVEF